MVALDMRNAHHLFTSLHLTSWLVIGNLQLACVLVGIIDNPCPFARLPKPSQILPLHAVLELTFLQRANYMQGPSLHVHVTPKLGGIVKPWVQVLRKGGWQWRVRTKKTKFTSTLEVYPVHRSK